MSKVTETCCQISKYTQIFNVHCNKETILVANLTFCRANGLQILPGEKCIKTGKFFKKLFSNLDWWKNALWWVIFPKNDFVGQMPYKSIMTGKFFKKWFCRGNVDWWKNILWRVIFSKNDFVGQIIQCK